MFFLLCLLSPARAQETGTIGGTVTAAENNAALMSINVMVKGTMHGAVTSAQGTYIIAQVPAGSHTLVFSAVGYRTKEVRDVNVVAGQTVTADAALEESAVPMGEVSVFGASLRKERITEAPAAVSVIEIGELQRGAGHGQLPRLLESQPGVDIVQSGVQDFNINTRGFNSSLNRRLLVLQDGRDLAIAFLGAQEWNGLTSPLDDYARMELVRGPGSALYGPNAFNGVINITSPSPRDIQGTKMTLGAGELNMVRSDLRHAGMLANQWSYKLNIGAVDSRTWSESRTLADTNAAGEFEYSGLRKNSPSGELRPLSDGNVRSRYGSARLDYNYTSGHVATIEGGMSQVENEVFVTGIGRVQVTKAEKPWGRLHYGTDRLNVTFWGQGRSSVEPQYSLASGAPLDEFSSIYHSEAQYNFTTLSEQVRIVLGASHRLYFVNTRGTLMADEHSDNMSGVFGQAEWSIMKGLKFVGASRWDRSTLHKDQFSPKGALVWSPLGNHSLRATVNKAFQVPNYSEFFLRANAGVAEIPFFATPSNPRGRTPILARGNANLKVEKITGYELGYKGILFDNKLFVTADGYYNRLRDFVTDLLQATNADYPFTLPPGFPAGLADLARGNVPGLAIVNGAPAVVVSYTNAGKVNEQGVELAFNYYLGDHFIFNGNWTWYDFQVKEQKQGDVLLPNAPKHKFAFGVAYRSRLGYDVEVSGRNVQPFRWAAGVFQGEIPAYTLLNLSAGYKINQIFRINGTVSNLLDHKVYQIFGGSVIGRQAIASVTATF